MDLEQRVEILEKEVELLKGEIQALLLDMQDYLLSQAHPELRGELPVQAVHPVAQPPASPTAPEQQPPAVPSPPPVRAVPAPPQPNVSDPDDTDLGTSPTLPGSAMFTDTKSPEKLQEWTMHKLKRSGSTRTREVLNRYLVNGRLSAEQYEGAMQIVERYGEAADKMRASRTTETPPPAPPIANPKPRSSNAKDESNEQTNLVLRLIAGVHNAGIGVTRRQRNG